MKKDFIVKACIVGMFCTTVFFGCSGKYGGEEQEKLQDTEETEISEDVPETVSETESEELIREPEVKAADWSGYFHGLEGCAVLYDPLDSQFWIYNEELALTRRSPCSTFKIISSLAALENGIIRPEDSTRTWSGEVFWNEKWNHDLDFKEAFRESCVWYFREVIDEIGKDRMQEELDTLSYGNCDISDWEGRQNTNNNNRALTGFWIESSLAVSPKEQTEVMERIFGGDSPYSEETIRALREVMLTYQGETGLAIYGKTGMGKAHGVLVDAWFTGFAENGEEKVYFCVYLGETEEPDVSSATAKEIAVQLLEDYCQGEKLN